MIRVVIAEDQAMVLGALAALLEIEGDIDVVGRARDGEEALALCNEEKPDVLLTDIEMPKMTGLELAAAVRRAQLPTRVIILTTFARGGYLRRALEAGASGYLLKDSPAAELIWASPRELLNIFQAAAIGCQIITVTNDILKKLDGVGKDLNQFSLETVKMFRNDAVAAGFWIEGSKLEA